jgi:hypothetical protein
VVVGIAGVAMSFMLFSSAVFRCFFALDREARRKFKKQRRTAENGKQRLISAEKTYAVETEWRT